MMIMMMMKMKTMSIEYFTQIWIAIDMIEHEQEVMPTEAIYQYFCALFLCMFWIKVNKFYFDLIFVEQKLYSIKAISTYHRHTQNT